MNAVVSAMASIIPSGKGIECLNYHFYEGNPVVGCLSDNYKNAGVLLAELFKQLDDQDEKRSEKQGGNPEDKNGEENSAKKSSKPFINLLLSCEGEKKLTFARRV